MMTYFRYLLLPLAITNMAHAQTWNAFNNPFLISRRFQSVYTSLPMQGQLKDARKGWPANHWANYLGGISHRWSSGNPQNFSYQTLSPEELKNSEHHVLGELSPAEKYDIFNQRYSYPLVQKMWDDYSPYENTWHGICHGVAPASMNHAEPKMVTLMNEDGIQVTFYSSDVAALMSYYYATVANDKAVIVGRRCNYDNSTIEACTDINPGAMHIIMANRLGFLGESYIADIDQKSEVWNHVAVSFKSTNRGMYPSALTSSPMTASRIKVETTVTYASAIAPKYYPVLGTPDAEYVENSYEYFLDIDKKGKIIGGEWISKRRPDFIWLRNTTVFEGEWSALNEIYQPID